MERTYQKGDCPNCATATLYQEGAGAGGAVVFDSGELVKPGQRVTKCDSCGEVVAVASSAKKSAKKKAPAKRRPQARKSARRSSSANRRAGKKGARK